METLNKIFEFLSNSYEMSGWGQVIAIILHVWLMWLIADKYINRKVSKPEGHIIKDNLKIALCVETCDHQKNTKCTAQPVDLVFHEGQGYECKTMVNSKPIEVGDICECIHPVPQATLSHLCQNFNCWKPLRTALN